MRLIACACTATGSTKWVCMAWVMVARRGWVSAVIRELQSPLVDARKAGGLKQVDIAMRVNALLAFVPTIERDGTQNRALKTAVRSSARGVHPARGDPGPGVHSQCPQTGVYGAAPVTVQKRHAC